MNMKEKARALARERHQGQLYNDVSYAEGHLEMVATILEQYDFDDDIVVSGLLHDCIEDTATTREELEREFGKIVADVVWACTGVGETRKIRNEAIYEKIAALPKAAPVKCADRICHVEEGTKREMYRREQDRFEREIRPHVPAAMWDRLTRAFQ